LTLKFWANLAKNPNYFRLNEVKPQFWVQIWIQR